VRQAAEASAADAVRIAQQQFKLKLDGSEASIDDVERVLIALNASYAVASPKPKDAELMPFATGAHAGMGGAFTILGFPEPADPEVVYVNYNTGNVFLEKTEELRRFALIFNHLRAAALSVSETRTVISQLVEEL